MRALMLALIILFAMTTTVAAAQYQVQCWPRDVTVETLDRKYGEKPVAMGQVFNGNILEVLISPSGSWSIIITRPNGMACMITSGENWEVLPPTSIDALEL